MRVFIVGAGGHGQDVADIARACGHTPAFLDDRDRPGVVGRPWEAKGRLYTIAVNDPQVRARLAVDGQPLTLVHPTATVSETARIGPGVVVGAGTQIGPGTVLEDHVHVGPGCTITRTHVGAFTSVGPGVDIAGDCRVGPGVLIGVGATVLNLKRLGWGATVGAGAVVTDHVPAGYTVVGVPARPLDRKEHA